MITDTQNLQDATPITREEIVAKRDSFADTLVKLEAAKANYKAMLEAFEAQHKPLLDEILFLGEAKKQGETDLRDSAVRFFNQEERRDRVVTEAVKIEMKTIAVYDPVALRDAAFKVMPDLLVLDTIAIDQLALAFYDHPELMRVFSVPLKAEKEARAELSLEVMRGIGKIGQAGKLAESA